MFYGGRSAPLSVGLCLFPRRLEVFLFVRTPDA